MSLVVNRRSIELLSGDLSLVRARDDADYCRCAHACCYSHGHNTDIDGGAVDGVPTQGTGEGNGRGAYRGRDSLAEVGGAVSRASRIAPRDRAGDDSTETVVVRAISPLVEFGISIGRCGQETGKDETPSSIHLEVGFLPFFKIYKKE